MIVGKARLHSEEMHLCWYFHGVILSHPSACLILHTYTVCKFVTFLSSRIHSINWMKIKKGNKLCRMNELNESTTSGSTKSSIWYGLEHLGWFTLRCSYNIRYLLPTAFPCTFPVYISKWYKTLDESFTVWFIGIKSPLSAYIAIYWEIDSYNHVTNLH